MLRRRRRFGVPTHPRSLPTLPNKRHGYNSALFAYGQTGSGKTYTMQGKKEDEGLIPRMMDALFWVLLHKAGEDNPVEIECSYFEIYNEKTRDLLKPGSKELKVRESKEDGVFIEGLAKVAATSSQDIQSLMDEGMGNRTIGKTNMNAESSRSHSIFMVFIRQMGKVDETKKKKKKKKGGKEAPKGKLSKLSLIDLAGSERVLATGATGSTLKEGGTKIAVAAVAVAPLTPPRPPFQ